MTSPVKEGDILAGKYRVERVLGEGGMGIVVAATHLDLDQKVALKFLLPDALAHPEIIERFAREARAVAKIRSQHVVRVIDTGKMENGTPFMVMEYLEGKDLSGVLEEEGRVPIEMAVDYVLQACEAMAEAHAVGIVHRDLKPANLFLAKQPDRRSIVKVLDFGISKVVDPKSAQLTRTATMMGSPHYMSPEQLTSTKHVDARADIWALGVILYELVSGNRPYDAETMPEIVARILGNTPVPIAELRTEVPPALATAIMRCLSSKIENRFETVAGLATALSPFSSDQTHSEAAASRMSRVLGPSVRPPSLTNEKGANEPGTNAKGLDRSTLAQTTAERRGGEPQSARIDVNGGGSRDAAHVQTQMATTSAMPMKGVTPARAANKTWVGLAAGGAIAIIGVVAFVATRSGSHDANGHDANGAGAAPPSIASDVAAVTPASPSAPVPTPPMATQATPIPPPPDPPVASAQAPSTPKSGAKHAQSRDPKPAVTPPPVAAPAAPTPKKNPLDMGIK